jgi:hypothetical protein
VLRGRLLCWVLDVELPAEVHWHLPMEEQHRKVFSKEMMV